jgi:putative ABC transport system permease protein
MSLFKIAYRSIQQRWFASSLTAISMGLGVALVVAVLVIHGIISKSFMTGAGLGYNLVIGADKGGKLQLVLNTVYYLSSPVENIPWSFYKEFTDGKYKGFVAKAIPLCLGDYYEDFRVVGTTPQFMDELTYDNGRNFEFATGHNFNQNEFFTGVIGAQAARQLNLKVGDTFVPTHGVKGEDAADHDAFKIVGVLKPTGTPNDRALFINMEGFLLTGGHAKPLEQKPGEAAAEHEHEHDAHDADHPKPVPEAQREVTAILVLTSAPPGAPPELIAQDLLTRINEGVEGQAVQPIREIAMLFRLFVEPVKWLLLGLTVLIVIVAGISILVSIYNSMSERKHDIAVMRALGAGRGTVMVIVLLESILLALAGGLLGWVLGHLLIFALNPVLEAEAGVRIGLFQFVPLELVIIPGLIVLAAIVGYLPALVAYRTDVAKALSATP